MRCHRHHPTDFCVAFWGCACLPSFLPSSCCVLWDFLFHSLLLLCCGTFSWFDGTEELMGPNRRIDKGKQRERERKRTRKRKRRGRERGGSRRGSSRSVERRSLFLFNSEEVVKHQRTNARTSLLGKGKGKDSWQSQTRALRTPQDREQL